MSDEGAGFKGDGAVIGRQRQHSQNTTTLRMERRRQLGPVGAGFVADAKRDCSVLFSAGGLKRCPIAVGLAPAAPADVLGRRESAAQRQMETLHQHDNPRFEWINWRLEKEYCADRILESRKNSRIMKADSRILSFEMEVVA